MSGAKKLQRAMSTCRVVAIPTRKKKVFDDINGKVKEVQMYRIKPLM